MPGVVLVPMQLAALVLPGSRRAVPPPVDFARLPWTDGQHDHNAGAPFLSQSVLTGPFADNSFELDPGTHLHWTLPAVYRRAFAAADTTKPDAQSHLWAPVPNFWLVRRIDGAGASDVSEREWVVESDVLTAPGHPERACGSYLPHAAENGQPPFRLLGRTMPLEQWLADTSTPERKPDLTAMGYGDPGFASYYPSVSRAFGFHDPDPPGVDGQTSYEVIGWRREGGSDFLGWLLSRTSLGVRHDFASLVDGEKPKLGWQAHTPAGKRLEAPEPPDLVVCEARIVVQPTRSARAKVAQDSVAIGANAQNTLTAHLAQTLANGGGTALSAARLEEQIDHLSLRPALQQKRSDRYFKLLETRHEAGFRAVSGGGRWRLRNEPPDGAADAAAAADRRAQRQPAALRDSLREINALEADYARLDQQLADRRACLFADWHRFQRAMYPVEIGSASAAHVDEIKAFIERVSLPEADAALHARGEMDVFLDARGRLSETSPPYGNAPANQAPTSAAARLAAALEALVLRLERFNRTFVSGEPSGDVPLETDPAIGGYLRFAGAGAHVWLDHLDGLPGARLRAGQPLDDLTLVLFLRLASGEGGVVLSFDPKEWLELAVPADGPDAGHLVLTTVQSDGTVESLTSEIAVATGSWRQVTITYSARTRQRSITIDHHPSTVAAANAPLGGRTTRQGCLGASAAARPFTDEQVPSGSFTGAITGLRLALGEIAPARLATLRDPKDRPALALRSTAGPRYWQPREPVVAVIGDAAAAHLTDGCPRDDHFPHHPLTCTVIEGMPARLFLGPDKQRTHAIVRELRYFLARFDRANPMPHRQQRADGRHWQPIIAEWEVALQPLAASTLHSGEASRYDPAFVETAYKLGREDVEPALLPGLQALQPHASFVTGSSLIGRDAAPALLDRLDAATKAAPERAAPELALARQRLDEIKDSTLTFPLGGLLAAMLQKRQVLQLQIDDPLAFHDYRALTGLVREAVCEQRTLAPDPTLAFNPIQSGAVSLRRLRLLDSFGQSREIRLDTIERTTSLAVDGHPSLLSLPLRLVQPARIDLRWLDARRPSLDADDGVDDGGQSSPIAGWLTVNDLDRVIVVNDARGQPQGMLVPDSALLWQAVPGMERPVAPSMIADPALGRVVAWLIRQGGRFIDLFVEAVVQSLADIHPESFGGDEWAILSGRPLAVVRARLALELQGLPATDQGEQAFYRDLHGSRRAGLRRDSAGYEDVDFPVRIGDHRQVDSGLVGYWLETDEAGRLNGTFHAPNAEAVERARTKGGHDPASTRAITGAETEPVVPLSLAAPARRLTLLVDPRGHLQATSGILPAKTITLPEPFYAPAIARLKPQFLTAPVLSPADQLCLPLPRHQGLDWDWLERGPSEWRRIEQRAIKPPRAASGAAGRLEIREGWLELARTPADDPNPAASDDE